MTAFTFSGRWNMCSCFTFRRRTVMAARTTGGNTRVIHRRSLEAGGRLMTGFTGRSGGNMGGRFAFGFGAVMTAGTARGDAGMVHHCTFKAGS